MNKLLSTKLKSRIAFKKWVILLIAVFVIMLLPYFFSKSYAENKVKNTSEIFKTETYNSSKLSKFFSPEYIVYSKTGEQEQATYIKLQRDKLFFWKVVDFKILEEETEQIQKSLDEDKLSPDDFGTGIDPAAIDVNTTSPNYEPGSALTEINTSNGDKIQVIIGSNQQDNELVIKGAPTGINNVYSVSLSFDEKYLYYTKFTTTTLDDGFIITSSDSNVYRYNINSKAEEKIYAFGDEISLSFRVNSTYIFYANGKNEVGTINLATKEKSTFDTSKLAVSLESELHGDVGEYTPLSILNIDEEYGILRVDVEGGEPLYFTIRLQDLAIDE